jgi:hypothetical protein
MSVVVDQVPLNRTQTVLLLVDFFVWIITTEKISLKIGSHELEEGKLPPGAKSPSA